MYRYTLLPWNRAEPLLNKERNSASNFRFVHPTDRSTISIITIQKQTVEYLKFKSLELCKFENIIFKIYIFFKEKLPIYQLLGLSKFLLLHSPQMKGYSSQMH